MLNTRSLRTGLLAAVLLVSLTVPSVVVAQETSAAPTPGVVAPLASLETMPVQVQVWLEAEPNATVMIIGSGLATDTPLPARVQLPIPDGAQLIWAGEIGGTGPESDVQAEATIVDVAGGKAVEFTVTQFRVFQCEVYTSPPVTQGDRIVTTFDWVHSLPFAVLSVAWRVPSDSSDIQLVPDAPGSPQINEVGERLYTLATVAPPVGERLTFMASYARAEAVDSGAGVDVLTIVLILLAFAVLALIVVVSTQRSRAQIDQDE